MKIPDTVCTACERFWLFTIAAIALAIVGMMIAACVWLGRVPADAKELFSATGLGLLMIAQKVIEAAGARRLADQLYRSAPAEPAA